MRAREQVAELRASQAGSLLPAKARESILAAYPGIRMDDASPS